jgi:hypothetical protein
MQNEHPFHGEVCCFCGLPISITVENMTPQSGVWHHYDVSLKRTNRSLWRKTLGTKNGFTVPAHCHCHASFHSKGNLWALGYRHSQEEIEKIRLAGLSRTEEHNRRRIAKSNASIKALGLERLSERARKAWETRRKSGNTSPSMETRLKMSLAKKGKTWKEIRGGSK